MKKRQASNEPAWDTAKKLCGLSPRQGEMAQALGMNPRKLPRLVPTPAQRWKLNVGAFIEACYRKRFGAPSGGDDVASRRSEHRSPVDAREQARVAQEQVENLVCYFANLADDLGRWLAHGAISPEILTEVRGELRAITEALDTGASIPQLPGISVPPDRGCTTSRRDPYRSFDDDDDDPPF